MDELQDIVQRMIDAGEPEDNIALVIQSYKAEPVEKPSGKGSIKTKGLDPNGGIIRSKGNLDASKNTIRADSSSSLSRFLDEADTAIGPIGYRTSVGDFVNNLGSTAKGFGKGMLWMDPSNEHEEAGAAGAYAVQAASALRAGAGLVRAGIAAAPEAAPMVTSAARAAAPLAKDVAEHAATLAFPRVMRYGVPVVKKALDLYRNNAAAKEAARIAPKLF